MGQAYATTKPKYPPKGCFWTAFAGHGWLGIGPWITDGRSIDCDCRDTGACPAAPPPLPPIAEFLELPLDKLYLDCPLPDQLPDSNDYSGWSFPIEEGAPGFGVQPPRSIKRSPDGYVGQLQRAFRDLPVDKQHVLLSRFRRMRPMLSHHGLALYQKRDGTGKARSGDYSHDADTSAMLNLLLATPEENASRIIASLSKEDANTLLACAGHAVDFALQEFKKVGEEPGGTFTPQQVEFYNFLITITHLWKAHTPDGLSRSITSGPFSSNRTEGPHPAPFPQSANVCDVVVRDAISNVKENPELRYVASFERTVQALIEQMNPEHNNTFHDVLTLREDIGIDLNWSENNTRAVFAGAFPAVAVGMNFFSLSVFTGAVAKWV